MAYVLPQVQVFQEFRIAPTAVEAPRQAHITGGHAALFRYSEAEEKAVIGVGEYDPADDTPYLWPERPVGAKVDLDYVKLYCDSALLRFYQDLIGQGGLVVPVSGYKNRIRSATTNFKANGEDYPLAAALLDRGAKVGDVVYVRGIGSDTESHELFTKISGFVGDPVAATVDTADAADTNDATAGALTAVDAVGDLKNTITLTVDGSAYDGRVDGDVDETYTIEVTQSSVSGDLTTALLRVTSLSGNDDVDGVEPAAVGGFTSIGTRGLLVEFDRLENASTSSHAVEDEISPDDLVVGQKWKVRVRQDFTATVATSGGSYTGAKDTTYIVEVATGGAWADVPTVRVTTTTGYDKSGPTPVTAAATAVAVGNYGVTIQFAGTGLSAGDKFYIEVTAETEGDMKTLVLQDDLPVLIQAAVDLDLKLFLKDDVLIPKNRETDPPLTNYELEATQIVVAEGITLFHPDWTDDGEQAALPLVGGSLFVEYRAWLTTWVDDIGEANDPSALEAVLGTIHPDNPLGWGVFMAANNSGGQPVRFSAVTDPTDLEDWLDALSILVGRDDVYNLVPLTTLKTVQDAWKGHIESQSSPENGRWRGGVFGIAIQRVSPVITEAETTDGEVALATLSDDPQATGTQYTVLSVGAGNAKFITNGVEAGDVVRYLFDTDGFGNDTYTEFVIDEVLSENTVRLAAGNDIPISVAQKAEVWRTLKPTGLTQAVVDEVGQWASRRIVAVANETIGNAGLTFPGYFAAAALAGLMSAVNPHQGLTNVTLTGIDDVGDLVKGLNGSQLNEIAGAGGWIIFKTRDGNFINRHAVTTDNTDLNFREEMIRRNVDSISYTLLAVFEPYIGRTNVTPDTLAMMEQTLRAALDSLTISRTPRIGAQITSYEVVEIRQHALLKDRVVITVNLVVPYPVNNIELRLVV
jgi:hypothetical protein